MTSCCAMHRRVFLVGAAVAVVPLGGCFERETGPDKVHWDRDTCELCKMMISEAEFATEIRGGPKHKLYKFDDIGCAINWLNEQPWAGEPQTEIWVAARGSSRENVVWMDARNARFATGAMSPMNYGLAAAPRGPMSFEEMTAHILKDAPNHICKIEP